MGDRSKIAEALDARFGECLHVSSRARLIDHDDADAVMRHYQPNGAGKREHTSRPTSAAATRDPDERARRFFEEGLAAGPLAVSEIDDAIERGRLPTARSRSRKTSLASCRRNRGRGAVVHLCLPEAAQA